MVSLRGVLFQCSSARDQATLSCTIVLILFYQRNHFFCYISSTRNLNDLYLAYSLLLSVNRQMFSTFPGMMSSVAKVNKSLVAHFLDAFLVILCFLDVPKYSDMFDYIKGRRPAVYFKNQKSRCISSSK